jgi:3-phenylpropionate/trans-cinnamate dioxygenase ferredoxin component
MPWVDLVPASEIPPGHARLVEMGVERLCIVNCAGTYHVIDDTCTHENYSLSEGEVWEDVCEIECPQHASTFDLATGEATCLPATRPVRVYQARVEEGVVQADMDA